MDKDSTELQNLRILMQFKSDEIGGRLVATYQDVYVIKKFEGKQMMLVRHELAMMLRAEECSVPLLGRIYQNGMLVGFIMPYGRAVAPLEVWTESADAYAEKLQMHLTRAERLTVIEQLCDLIANLHSKGILHGDIKPSNLLRCADGTLRLFDFAEAMLESNASPPRCSTTSFQSPSRYNTSPPPPLSRKDDLYATGITIWEIYTARPHFYYLEDPDLDEDLVRAGIRPNLSLVDDEWIARVIVSFLDSGEMPLSKDVFPQPWDTCIASLFAFRDCLEEPTHTYTKVVHSNECAKTNSPRSGECPSVYTVPFAVKDDDCNLVCVSCRPVEYRGIGEWFLGLQPNV